MKTYKDKCCEGTKMNQSSHKSMAMMRNKAVSARKSAKMPEKGHTGTGPGEFKVKMDSYAQKHAPLVDIPAPMVIDD